MERAFTPVFSWVVKAEALQVARGRLGTVWHGLSPRAGPEAMPFTSPVGKVWTSLPRKGRVFLGQLAALRSLCDLARGPYSLSHLLLAGVCLWPLPCCKGGINESYFNLKSLGAGFERLIIHSHA